jgi:hypothetical protein
MSETSRQSPSHIDPIVRQEEEALERRSSPERLADGVGGIRRKPSDVSWVSARRAFRIEEVGPKNQTAHELVSK